MALSTRDRIIAEEACKERNYILAERRRKRKFERIMGAVAILLVLSIFPYIWTCQYIGFCFHKNQVDVGNMELAARGWSEQLEEYAIDFTVDIDVKRYDVSSIDFHTVVYKGDDFIGVIEGTLEGLTFKEIDGSERYVFEKNSEQTVYFTLTGWRNLEKSDALFRELYYGNPEDYRFETNIICVWFADGTQVGYYFNLPFDYEYDENGKMHITESYKESHGYLW